jgi:hypothetical protein
LIQYFCSAGKVASVASELFLSVQITHLVGKGGTAVKEEKNKKRRSKSKKTSTPRAAAGPSKLLRIASESATLRARRLTRESKSTRIIVGRKERPCVLTVLHQTLVHFRYLLVTFLSHIDGHFWN